MNTDLNLLEQFSEDPTFGLSASPLEQNENLEEGSFEGQSPLYQ